MLLTYKLKVNTGVILLSIITTSILSVNFVFSKLKSIKNYRSIKYLLINNKYFSE